MRRLLPGVILLLVLLLVLLPGTGRADYLEVRRPADLKQAPRREAAAVAKLKPGRLLRLLQDGQTDGYYLAETDSGGVRGWVYRTLVRRRAGSPPELGAPGETAPSAPTGPAAAARPLRVCSFNVKWLGHYAGRDDGALAAVLAGNDVVLVQELVCPPWAGSYPDGTAYEADPEAARFFAGMRQAGYAAWLSEEDTGKRNHTSQCTSEWWVAFYDSASVRPAPDLAAGFLPGPRAAHPVYGRVPYAFGFQARDCSCDFVLVSVHLTPGSGSADAQARRAELAAIARWIAERPGPERDYLIVGDTNIDDRDELVLDVPAGFRSLNEAGLPTNTNPRRGCPYDQVLWRPAFTVEMDTTYGFQVLDLVEAMREPWAERSRDSYPGDPYDGNLFPAVYSDHDPVTFRLVAPPGGDDD